MNNEEILKHIQEILKSDCFADNAAFQNFIKHKQIVISTSILVQAITDLFNSLIALITDSAYWHLETIRNAHQTERKRSIIELLFCMLRSGKD